MGNCFRTARSLPIRTDGASGGVNATTSTSNLSSRSTDTVTTNSGSKFSSVGSSNGQYSTTSSQNVEEIEPNGRILESADLRVYTFSELKSATKNFKPDSVLGEGGFGRVFKGWVDEKTLNPAKSGSGMVVAVKKLNQDSIQGWEEWQSEVNFLGRLAHPNLVKLLGYCWEDRELLLVYEFMAKGSLENHLFRRGVYQPLSWKLRLRILIDAACGLAFLHGSEKQIIYRDFKASNILLDSNYNAKISDFGLAKNGPAGGESHVTTRVLGTYGYAAPEYMATGHLYVKSDVYGFGVVLLEMMTGLRALDPNRPSGQHNLVDWAKPFLSDRRKLVRIMDSRLEGQYPSKAAHQAAQLALNCLASDPKKRPHMKEVAETLQQIENPSARDTTGKHPHQHRSRRHHRSPLHSRHAMATRVER